MATEGDVSGGSSGSLIQSTGKVIGVIDDFASLFRGSTVSNNTNNNKAVNLTTTTQEDVDPEKARALLEQLLKGVNGLAAISSGQKISGMYDSTSNMQLTNDLLASSTASIAALGKKTTQSQTGDVTDTSSVQQHKKGALEWIVCTELYRQGRMPHKFYRYGARVFASYSDRSKQGYYLWAVPAVKHLRAHPDSVLSAILQDVFVARAEYLAAQAGCKEARKTVAGFLTTHILFAVCVTLSRTIARKPIDFMSQVYPEGV